MKVKEAEENNLGSRSDRRQWGQEGKIGGSEVPGLGDSGKNPP